MRIADDPPFHAPVPASRRPTPYARVERIAAIPALPRHRRPDAGRVLSTRPRYIDGKLPPRGWLIDIYV